MSEPSDTKSAQTALLTELVRRKRAAGPAHASLNGHQGRSERAAAARSASKSKPALRK